jgi:hypothetical protein
MIVGRLLLRLGKSDDDVSLSHIIRMYRMEIRPACFFQVGLVGEGLGWYKTYVRVYRTNLL